MAFLTYIDILLALMLSIPVKKDQMQVHLK